MTATNSSLIGSFVSDPVALKEMLDGAMARAGDVAVIGPTF